jgi:hypothetical protein
MNVLSFISRRALIVVGITTFGIVMTKACPPGYYQDGTGLFCLPYGPPVLPPGGLNCAVWTANPMYAQTVTGINASQSYLQSNGVTDQGSCQAKSPLVAIIVAHYTGVLPGAIADSLVQCACLGANFTSAPPPQPLFVCHVDQPPAPPLLCNGNSSSIGQPCFCNVGNGNQGYIQVAPTWWIPTP